MKARAMGKRKLTTLFLILAVVMVLQACGKSQQPAADMDPEPAAAEEENETAEEPAEEEPPEEPPKPFTYPFTGLGSDTEVKDRPIVVMVENSPAARPQDGLHKADIVYEVLAEGEITRFVTVFQSQEADIIGPVRSLRPYFAEIGDGLDGYIVHAGWSAEAGAMIAKRKLANFDEIYGDGAYYWRDKSRKAPHNLYTSTALIREGAVKKKYRQEWNAKSLKFYEPGAEPAIAGEPAASLKVHYIRGYNVSYEYDAESGLYKRLMADKPHTDKTSGTQITARNVMVIFAKHRIVDDAGRREVDVFGPGEGHLFQQGRKLDIEWKNEGGVIRPFAGGQEVPLLPGQTWVQIVPIGSKVEYQ